MDVMLRCIKVRKRYITLVKRCKYSADASAAAGGAGSTGSTGTAFSIQDEAELRKIEDLIPIQALLVFRQFAAYEMINEMKKEERDSHKDKHKLPSFGWSSNSNSNNEKNSIGAHTNSNSINNGYGGRRGQGSGKGGTNTTSASSVSSWFKNLKKSKKSKDSTSTSSWSSSGGQQNQKYSKSLDRPVDINEYEANEEDDDRLIDLIQSRLDLDPAVVDQFIFRLIINASTALRLTSEGRPVALLELSMSGLTEMKADGIVITFAVEDFHLIDECTVDPLVRYLIICPDYVPSRHQSPRAQALSGHAPVQQKIEMRTTAKTGPVNPFLPVPVPAPSSSSSSSSSFSSSSSAFPSYDTASVYQKERSLNGKALPKLLISIDSRNGKSTLRLNIRPMEATWNELCVGRLLGIFMAPDVTHSIPGVASNTANSSSASSSTFSPIIAASMNKFALEAALPIAGEMELIIEIDAPKIIIPDNCFRDAGCLLADAGYLEIRGTYSCTYIVE